MRRKTEFVIIFSALLLTMCSPFANESVYSNGLNCRNSTGILGGGDGGASCAYVCPDGNVVQISISDTVSHLYAVPKEELDATLCGVALLSTPTQTQTPLSPTFTPSATLAASPTVQATLAAEVSPTLQTSLTAEIAVTGSSLLTGRVLMCDLGTNLINFRMVQAPPDLTGKTLTAQIADMESACYVNPTNPSLLTCTIPSGVTFPARVIVSLDGAVVNDFVYGGIGCEMLTTAIPTTTP